MYENINALAERFNLMADDEEVKIHSEISPDDGDNAEGGGSAYKALHAKVYAPVMPEDKVENPKARAAINQGRQVDEKSQLTENEEQKFTRDEETASDDSSRSAESLSEKIKDIQTDDQDKSQIEDSSAETHGQSKISYAVNVEFSSDYIPTSAGTADRTVADSRGGAQIDETGNQSTRSFGGNRGLSNKSYSTQEGYSSNGDHDSSFQNLNSFSDSANSFAQSAGNLSFTGIASFESHFNDFVGKFDGSFDGSGPSFDSFSPSLDSLGPSFENFKPGLDSLDAASDLSSTVADFISDAGYQFSSDFIAQDIEPLFANSGFDDADYGNDLYIDNAFDSYSNSGHDISITSDYGLDTDFGFDAYAGRTYDDYSDANTYDDYTNAYYNPYVEKAGNSGNVKKAHNSRSGSDNDVLTISNLGGDKLNYTEGDGAAVIEQGGNVVLSDVGSANFDAATLTVSFTGGSDSSEDVLAINYVGNGPGEIKVAGPNLFYSGKKIGTFTGGSGSNDLVITLNANANASAVEALIEQITYENTNTDNPSAGNRTIRYVLTDGDGGTSVDYDTSVNVIAAVNAAPMIANLGADTLYYSEGDGAAVIEQGGNVVLSDVDSANFDSGTLTVSFAAGSDSAEDVLAINHVGNSTGEIGISGSNVSYGGTRIATVTGGSLGANLVITLDADANAAAVEALIKQITYENTNTNNPTAGNRTVRYVLTDGDGGTSTNYDTTVAFTAINDATTIANLGGDTLNYSKGDGAAVIEQGANVVVLDVDSANFDSGTLTVSFAAGSDSAEDVLAIKHVGNSAGEIGISGSNVSYGGTQIATFTGGSLGANLVITLNANADAMALEALIEQITYENTAAYDPNTGIRTVRYVLTDGDGGTSVDYDTSVNVNESAGGGDVNDAPTIANLGGDTLAYSEGDGAAVIEHGGNVVLSDVDSANFDSGTLTVSFAAGSDSAEDVLAINHVGNSAGEIGISGSNVSYGGTQIATFTGGSLGANLVITLDADANAAAVEALIEQITYENTDTDNPTAGDRTVRYVLTDGDGGTSVNYDTTVAFTAINDATTIANLGGDTLAYSEGDGAAVIEQGANVVVLDVDSANFDTDTLTVSFTGGSDSSEDLLAINHVGNSYGEIGISGSNVSYGGTQIATFKGGSSGANLVITLDADANAAAVAALIEQITYENTDVNNPTMGNRTVRYVLTDGSGGTSINYDTTVAFTAVNDATTIANLGGDTLAYSEGDGALVIEQGANVVVSDVDSANFDTGTLTVSFEAGSNSVEDVLAINHVGNGPGEIKVAGPNVFYSGTKIGTFSGGSSGNDLVITFDADADATAVEALIEQITFENTNTDNPTTGNRTVRYVLTDGDGGTSANYDTTVNVSAVNDASTIANLGGDTLNYSEGDGAAVIEQGANTVITDVDSANFDTGTLTVSFEAGSESSEDVLAINSVGTGSGEISIHGSEVRYEGSEIAQFSGGSSGENLVITFDANADASALEALIEQITFENTNTDNPTTGNRTVRYVLTDGDGGTSANYEATVSVNALSAAPTISNLAGDSIDYVKGDGAVEIEQGADPVVADVDSSNFDTGTLTVSFVAGSDPLEDVLSIHDDGNDSGDIGVNGNVVSYGGTQIGTFTGGSNGEDLVITFDANADADAVSELLEEITYENTNSNNPTAGTRTVRYVLTDGDGGTSANYDATVNIAPNVAPTISKLAGDSIDYVKGDGAVEIEQGADPVVADVDSSNFDTGTLTVSFVAGSDALEDVLSIHDEGNGKKDIGVNGNVVSYGGTQIGTFTGGSNGEDLVITFDANADADAVSELLEEITYENTNSNNPAAGTRTVRYVLTDGDGGTSANYDATVNIAPNVAPTISKLAGDSIDYVKGDGAVEIEQGADPVVADADSSNFDTGTLTVSFVAGSDSAEDVLSIHDDGNDSGDIGVNGNVVSYSGTQIGTFTGGSNGEDLVITFDANADADAVSELLEEITYENTNTDNPTAGNRTVRYVLTDGDGGISANYDATVNIAPNVAPTISNLGGDTINYTEGDGAVEIEQGADPVVADADSSNFDTGTLTVSFVAGSDPLEDVLSIHDDGNDDGDIGVNGNVVSYGGTQIGTFTGGSNGEDLVITFDANADADAVSELLEEITYENTNSNNPTVGNRTVRYVLTDGDGGTSANYDATVNIAPNAAPTIANLAGDSIDYVKGDGAVEIEQGADPVVADADSSNFDTGTLTVSFVAGSDPLEDVLSIHDDGNDDGDIGVNGNVVSYGGTQIGTFTGGSNGEDLVITFDEDADKDAVSELLEEITYENTNTDNPSVGNRTVRYVLTDGDGGISANYDATVNIAPNAAPTIANLGGDTINYTEGDGAVEIEQGADPVVADVDSSNFDTGTLTVSFVAGSDPLEDVLSIHDEGNDDGDIGVNGNVVSYDGTQIGTFTGGSNGEDLVITFDANADADAVSELLEEITYENTNTNNPTPGNRTVRYVLTDGDGGTSANYDVTVAFTAVNEVSTISGLANSVSFDENTVNAAAQIIDSAVVFADADSTDLNGGNLTVTYAVGGGPEDQLSIANQGSDNGQIGVSGTTVSYEGNNIGTISSNGVNGANLIIALNTASATVAAVDALIQALTYANTSDTPASSRILSLTVNDGDGGTTVNHDIAVTVNAEAEAEADPVDLTLTSDVDNFVGAGAADTFTTTEANFAAADTLIGDSGLDTLTFNDAATITTAELANKTGLDIIKFSANSTAAISDAFVGASDNDTLELNNQAFTLSLDISDVSAPETVEIGGTGQVTLSAGGVISSKDGINTNIAGSSDADTFNSGTGADTYTGGGDADIFIWNDISTSSGDDSARDVITDFSISEGDKLDISGMSSDFNARGMSSFAGETNQVIWEQSGDDTLISFDAHGDDGADWSLLLENFEATDLSYNEFVWGSSSTDTTTGDSGEDDIEGTSVIDFIYGHEDDDTLEGGDNGDYIVAGSGKDRVYGNAGNDYLYAANGDGTGGDDERTKLYGGAGDDFLFVDAADSGKDKLYGGKGNDTFFGAAGSTSSSRDYMYGEEGDDRFDFTYGEDVDLSLWGGDKDDASGNDHVRLHNVGMHGGNWTLTSDTDYTSSNQGNGITRYTFDSDDAEGSISMNDGSDINFTDIDYIEFD